jgi:phosphoribosylaminoimidazole carboxylase PurE protein
MPGQKIVILIGSASDMPFAHRVTDYLQQNKFPIKHEFRINSAHRNPQKLLSDLQTYEKTEDQIVFITVAGMSDALSGTVAGSTLHPVIACPPDLGSNRWEKAYSTFATPKGIAVALVHEPENAALAAVKILAESNPQLRQMLRKYMIDMRESVKKLDADLQKKGPHEHGRENVERVSHIEHGEHFEEPE